MSKTVTMRLRNSDFEWLKTMAKNSNQTVSAYLYNKVFPSKPNLLTVDRILERINELKAKGVLVSGSKSTIAGFFDISEYSGYFNVIPIGRTFYEFSQDPTTEVYRTVKPISNTKPVQYLIR